MNKLLWGLAGLAIIVMVAVAVYIRQQYLLPESESMAFFEVTEELQQLYQRFPPEQAAPSSIKVVYFWQNLCPCDEFVKPHFLLMQKYYQQHFPQRVSFYLAPLHANDSEQKTPDLRELPELPSEMIDRVRHSVKATPAVAVWDEKGELTYYGPHSLGYICNDETSFVKKVVDRLLSGEDFQPLDVVGDGCFCKASW